ncbi:hypothetical protein [Streptomyces sp. NPDC048392]|uniref:hypothetical protein n=1 Tax=Streptomyces sp. NPDC048392 TaxID=3365543 RepID=UPI00371EB759
MSEVTRQPGGIPVERDRQTPDARGETAPGTDRTAGTPPVSEARGETVPGTDRTAGAPPAPEARSGRLSDAAEPASGPRTKGTAATAATPGSELLPHEEWDKLGQRLHQAVAGFVDAPRASVEEADRVLEEITARFTDAVTHRRRTLRTSWQDTGEDSGAVSTDTEQLRLALRDYRELADRLMRL